MADDLEQSIRENAQQPAKTSVDSVNVEQHSLADQIEADRSPVHQEHSSRVRVTMLIWLRRALSSASPNRSLGFGIW